MIYAETAKDVEQRRRAFLLAQNPGFIRSPRATLMARAAAASSSAEHSRQVADGRPIADLSGGSRLRKARDDDGHVVAKVLAAEGVRARDERVDDGLDRRLRQLLDHLDEAFHAEEFPGRRAGEKSRMNRT